MRARALGSLVAVLAFCACATPRVPLDESRLPASARDGAFQLKESVEAIVSGGWNPGRRVAIRARIKELGLGSFTHEEPIDWFSTQSNVVIEFPGRTKDMIYVVAHYDKTDMNPFKLVSVLLNGMLDDVVAFSFMSDGAIDNATGVAVALNLATDLAAAKPNYTYRFLLTGSEESGLRGARAHLARLGAEQRDAIVAAINIDTVGVRDTPNCITENVSDPIMVQRALIAANSLGVELGRENMPAGASTDVVPFAKNSFFRDFGRGLMFNLVGGLLPQRSWFTGAHDAQVINFTACDIMGVSDYVGATLLLPLGSLHGPRDSVKRVDIERLHELYWVVLKMIVTLEEEAAEDGVPQP